MLRRHSNYQDPLKQLFEHHLLNRSYEDASAFSKEVAREYLGYIDATLAHVPIHVRASLIEDLESEAHEMLIKKMYGVGPVDEATNFGRVLIVEPKKYSLKAVEFLPPASSTVSDDNSEER